MYFNEAEIFRIEKKNVLNGSAQSSVYAIMYSETTEY